MKNGFNSNAHHIGTTRMSTDPGQGVVDKNARVHGVDNLFLAGSSVFSTSGHANPTLLAVALALRLADFLGEK
jgi:choline dehydrogenase-like flavoprotein